MGNRTSRRHSRRDEILFGYSTNVHRGENLRQVYRSLRGYTIPIRNRVFGRRPAGLELRLGIGAARDLLRPGPLERFRAFLAQEGLRLFSINAFPLQDFHQKRVKVKVYRPSWTDTARVRWTRTIAGIFSEILPEGLTGSVSTLGGTYRAWGHGPGTSRRIAGNYVEILEYLARLEEQTGKRIVLAVEPEPDTTFETSADVISFFQDHLLPAAWAAWKRERSKSQVETILRRFFTVNLDACHHSVVFRNPRNEMALLGRAGIGIGTIPVSSALVLKNPRRHPEAYRELREIHEPRYLHQVRGAAPGGKVIYSAADLNQLPREFPGPDRGRRSSPLSNVSELRSHFHVPIHEARWKQLSTTHGETRELVREAVRTGCCNQLVIETYTWPILAGEGALVEGISREFRWLLKEIKGVRRRNIRA